MALMFPSLVAPPTKATKRAKEAAACKAAIDALSWDKSGNSKEKQHSNTTDSDPPPPVPPPPPPPVGGVRPPQLPDVQGQMSGGPVPGMMGMMGMMPGMMGMMPGMMPMMGMMGGKGMGMPGMMGQMPGMMGNFQHGNSPK